MAETDTRYSIRIPEDLYETIKRLSEEDTRSIHGEILVLLREAVAAREKAQKKDK